MEKFGLPKSPDILDKQLSRAEGFFGNKIQPENVRGELLKLTAEEIKARYPREYAAYVSFLKLEAKIAHFPDMPKDKEDLMIDNLPATTRGSAFKVTDGDQIRAIKSLESQGEARIATTVDTLGVGPKQFGTKEGFLHEEFISGTPLLKLDPEKCTAVFMEDLGQKFGRALKKIHEKNIVVNDQLLTNDFGKSHTIIDEQGEIRFIDFGASVDVTHFPILDDDAVLSLMRTDPFMQFSIGTVGNMTEGERAKYILGYREKILSQFTTKEDIFAWKDGQLLNEGLYFLSQRLPNVQSFANGLKKES